MPVYEVALPDGRTYQVTSQTPLTDADAYQHATTHASAQPPAEPANQPGAVERFLAPLLPSTKPADYLEGPKFVAQHPLVSAGLVGSAIAEHPTSLIPVVGRMKPAYDDLRSGNYAGAAGNVTGALLDWFGLKKAAPNVAGLAEDATSAVAGAASDATRAATRGAGRATSAIGRGADVVNEIVPATKYAVNGKGVQRLGDALQSIVPPSSPVDHYMPNRGRTSREVPGFRMPEGPIEQPALPTSSLADVDRYMPNTSDLTPNGYSPSIERVPYGSASPEKPPVTAASPRLAGTSAPSLTDTLNSALESVRSEGPDAPSKLADTPSVRFQNPDPADAFRRQEMSAAYSGPERRISRGAAPEGVERRSIGARATELRNEGIVPPKDKPAGAAMVNDAIARERAAAPSSKLDQAVSSLGDPPSFTDWAGDIDSIVNAATPDDLAQFPPQTGLRSKAWKDFINKPRVPDAWAPFVRPD